MLVEIGAAIEWWRTNRDEAPSALEDELDAAISDLEERGAWMGLPVQMLAMVAHAKNYQYTPQLLFVVGTGGGPRHEPTRRKIDLRLGARGVLAVMAFLGD